MVLTGNLHTYRTYILIAIIAQHLDWIHSTLKKEVACSSVTMVYNYKTEIKIKIAFINI